MNKFLRDLSYVGVRNAVARTLPNFDQYLTASRLPPVPRIVVYSSDNQLSHEVVESIFPSMKWLAPSTDDVAKSDEEITRNIANQLITSEGQAPQGYIVEGFPFNVKQALLLDRYIKGVNLAIYFRSQNKSHEETITELLDYYDQRGNLVTWSFSKKPSTHQIRKLWHDILANIKLSS